MLCDTDPNTDVDTHSNPNPNTHSNPNPNPDTDADADANPDADADADPDTGRRGLAVAGVGSPAGHGRSACARRDPPWRRAAAGAPGDEASLVATR